MPRARRGRPSGALPAPSQAPSLLVLDHPNASDPSGATPDGMPSATLTLRLVGHLAQVPAGAEVLDLGPLSPMAVREIVAGHVGHGEVDDTTADVLARSGGWPGAVHDAAADIARTRARRLVEAAVVATGASSADLAAARADLADGVASLTGTRTLEPAPDPTECPWRGLAAYDVDDARWYAGRERLVAEVLSRMPGTRLLALVGASGSGKSSLMRAGLLAALRRDLLPGSAAWRVVTLRPGAHPMRELTRRALSRTDGADVNNLLRALVDGDPDTDERVVLAVDQLEEAWTVCHDEAERRQFLDALAELATDPRSPVSVVVALRADYLSELADHPELRTLVGNGTVLVGPLTPAEIRRAVERPAATARLTLDDGLADTIVSDAGQEPGLLPLLSTALTQLWEHRDNGQLTYPAYVGLGGLSGAIATLAEEAYADLTPTQQDAARTLLLRLTGPGDGAAVTRRRVPMSRARRPPHRRHHHRRRGPRPRPAAHRRRRHRRGRPRGTLPRVAAPSQLARRGRRRPCGPAPPRRRRRRVGRRRARGLGAVDRHPPRLGPRGRRGPAGGGHDHRAGVPHRQPGCRRRPATCRRGTRRDHGATEPAAAHARRLASPSSSSRLSPQAPPPGAPNRQRKRQQPPPRPPQCPPRPSGSPRQR